MASRQYRPRFKKQLDGSICGHANCNMCAAAMFADRQTLGLVQKTGAQMRVLSGTAAECLDNNKLNDGTSLPNAATALSKVGIDLDIPADIDITEFWAALDIRKGAIALGDYDRVPYLLRGSKDFLGFHSVYVNEHDKLNKRSLVYDPVDDGRRAGIPQGPIWWPDSILASYMIAFPGTALTVAFTKLQYLAPSVPVANVRAAPTRASAIISRAVRRERDRHEYGGTVIGERISGEGRWYRVWASELTPPRIGYMHASVVTKVPA